MSEWKKTYLRDLIVIKNGKDHKKLKNGQYPVYGSGGIMRYADSYLYDQESVLLPRKGTLNNIQFVTEPFWTVDTCYYTVVNRDKVLPYFLYCCLCKMDIQSLNTGSAVPSMTFEKYYSIEVPIPPLSTQHCIANILSRYDSLIENYQKQIKLLEEAAQRLYKEWFVDLHFPGHESTNIVDGVPEGWEIVTINDVTSKITTGLNPRKNFVLGNGNNYYVTIKNMANNTIYLDDKCDKIDDEAIEKINKRSDLKTGDILFSGIGTIGRVCLIDIPTNNWNVSESVFTLRANDMVSKEFMYLLLLGTDVQNYCQAHAHGAAQKGIRMADLKAFKFSLAPREVMQDFTRIVNPYINIVSRIQSQLRLLTEARDRLLPKLMSGEITV